MWKIKPKRTSFGLLDEYAELLIMIMKYYMYMEKFDRVFMRNSYLTMNGTTASPERKRKQRRRGRRSH